MKRLILVMVLISLMLPGAALADNGRNLWLAKQLAAWQDCVQVALGKTPADLAVRVGSLLDTYTGQWLADQVVATKGQLVCWTGPASEWHWQAATTVDYSQYKMIPAFGEAHTHLESQRLSPDMAARLNPLYGQSWVIEASHEFGNAVSAEMNVKYWLKGWDYGIPLNIYPDLPSAAPPTPFEFTGAGDDYSYANMLRIYQNDPRITMLDEVMDGSSWKKPVMPGYALLWDRIAATIAAGKVVQGHMSGYSTFDDISAGAAAHLSSDHENARSFDDKVSLGEEAYRKLTHGITLILRVADAEQIIPYLVSKGLQDWSHVTLTTDDRAVDEVYDIGGTSVNVKRTIAAGMPVEAAFQAASLNPATYAHVEAFEGSVTPGKFASFLLLKGDPANVDIAAVYVNGRKVVEGGKLVVDVPVIDWGEFTHTMNTGALAAADFAVKAPAGAGDTVTVQVLSPFYFKPDVPTATLPVVDGAVQYDLAQKLVKFAIVDRYHGKPNVGTMFWTGVGPAMDNAAFCETESHDNHYVQCLYTSDAAALQAVTRLSELGGGYIFVANGAVVAEVRLEIGGLMTATPPEKARTLFETFWKALEAYPWLGGLTAEKRQRFATLTCDPWQWVLVPPFAGCASGYVNVTTGECRAVVEK